MKGLDSLDLFDFGILLQALSHNLKVGTLVVRAETREKFLYLEKGKLVAIHTSKPRISLEKVLYNHRAIEKQQLRAAIEHVNAQPEDGPLGRYLVDWGVITPEQYRRAAWYQIVEEMLEVFYWKSVTFKFHHGEKPEKFGGKGMVPVGEPIDADSILIQCTKTIDDIAKFDEVTPSLRDVYELHIDSLETLEKLVPDPAQREFVLLIDGVRDMRDVLRDMRMNRFEVLEFFYRFRQQGWIRPKNAFELLMLAQNRRKEFSLEKRARLFERINELGCEGFEILLPLAETYEEMGAGERAAALFAKHARRCLDGNDLKGALGTITRATRLNPYDPELRQFEIEVLVRAGQTAEAAAACKALSTIRDGTGDLAGALTSIRQAAQLHPADPDCWRVLADLLEKSGGPRRAAGRLRRAGDAYRSTGQLDAAADAYRRAIELCPTAWSVRYRLVELLHDQGHDDVAVQGLAELVQFVMEKTPQLTPEQRLSHLMQIEQCLRLTGGLQSSAMLQLGRAYVQLGANEKALGVLRESGEALLAARRCRGAVEALEELVELAPSDLDGRRGLARAHLGLGDANRAVAQLRRAGSQLVQGKRWAEARDVYEEMLRTDPGCADAHCGLAQCLLSLGEARLASQHFHRAGLLHRGYGQAEAAVPFLRDAVEKSPNDAELLEEFCELLISTDRKDETIRALAALVDLRMAQGSPARAAIALTRILELDPRHPGAKQILQEASRQLACLAEESEEIGADVVADALEKASAGS